MSYDRAISRLEELADEWENTAKAWQGTKSDMYFEAEAEGILACVDDLRKELARLRCVPPTVTDAPSKDFSRQPEPQD